MGSNDTGDASQGFPGLTPASTSPSLWDGSSVFGGNPAYPDPSMFFAQSTLEAGRFTQGGIRTAVATGQQKLSSGDAKPCATCDKTTAFSLAFDVKDANGKMCGEGMYYTVKYETSGEVFQGSTDANGMTERYFSANPKEKIYLYLGKRTTADGYPLDQSKTEDATDEAPLANDTVAPIDEKKLHNAATKRLWKPWKASASYKQVLEDAEKRMPNQYASPEGGNDTIGIGHKITDAEISNKRFTQGNWAQPLSDALMDELLDEDIAKNGGNKIGEHVFVPLYSYEVDAILDLNFNGGPGALTASASSLFDENGNQNPAGTNRQNLSELLNRGRYSLVPDYLKAHYNTSNLKWSAGVQNRRDMDVRMFSGDTTNGYTMIYKHTNKKKAK